MQLPALVPKSLEYTSQIADDEALFKSLVKEPPDLIKFLVRAVADESWAEEHAKFMSLALSWVTNQFFQDKLMMKFAQRLGKALRAHYSVNSSFLPMNLTLKLKDRDLQVNSLIYGASSEYVRELIRRECRDRHRSILVLKDISQHIFRVLHDFVTTGSYLDIIHLEKPQVYRLLRLAMLWQLDELSKACQDVLKHYITRENVFDVLLRSYLRQRVHLLLSSMEFLNSLNAGFRLEDRGIDFMVFEFKEFSTSALEAFEKLRPYITHLVASGSVPEESLFPTVIKKCPKLVCIDLSRTNQFSDNFKELPRALPELELAACLWLTNEYLEKIIEICPELTRLSLQSDVRLDAAGFGALKKLEGLRELNLTRCTQLGDPDLGIILQACPSLRTLILEDCRSLSDSGFYEIPTFNHLLTGLNLSRTWISDLPLIEISTKCEFITSLNLTRCENLTSVGILECARNGKSLRDLIISSNNLSDESLQELHNIRPYLKVVF